MQPHRKPLLAALLLATASTATADNLTIHFPMEPTGYQVKEAISGKSFRVSGNFRPEAIDGAEGKALRLDGYSSYVDATIDTGLLSDQTLSISLWVALETYPMMVTDAAENKYTHLAGNLSGSEGFAYTLSSQGDYTFEFCANGSKVTCKGNGKMPKGEWVHLKALVSVPNGAAMLYRNGEKVGSVTFKGSLNLGGSRFLIGRSPEELKLGPCRLNTINGAFDDIRIYSDLIAGTAYTAPENTADLTVGPARFATDVQRPRFHGMPSANWTNETHGLIYWGGKYHVFFQKNGNGPYMARLHWGHLSSEDLVHWTEEPIAFGPSEAYDIKGTWSGCIYQDNELTGDKPHIFYTAVDNGHASVAEAIPTDDDLVRWTKNTANPVIAGRPEGLSDDFRDTYVFCHNGNYYLIVGTSKDGRGAATLHRYNKQAKTWSNDGSIFFQSNNANISGTFWEMPAIVPMGDKWVFFATPLGSARQGVEALYWVGDINDDGTFTPLPDYKNEPRELEMGTFGKDGYGLLSPSITQHNGKNLLLGIVPDKLSLEDNASLGWAHTYSLPREVALNADNILVQQPYSGLNVLRTGQCFNLESSTLEGTVSLSPASGRMAEIEASYAMSTVNIVGFDVRKNGDNRVRIYYNRNRNTLTVDARNADRLINDNGGFNGLYESVLPERAFQTLKLHIYIDHSIMDIFVNDKWAFSVRVFARDVNANDIEAFAEGCTPTMNYLRAWTLSPEVDTAIDAAPRTGDNLTAFAEGRTIRYEGVSAGTEMRLYDASGRLVSRQQASGLSGRLPVPEGGNFFLLQAVDRQSTASRKIVISD